MSLEKRDYLYRIRVVFNPSGECELAEVVHKYRLIEDGREIGEGDNSVEKVTPAKMQAEIAAFLARFATAKAEDIAEKEAEEARKAAEKAEAEAVRAAEEAAKAAEKAAAEAQ